MQIKILIEKIVINDTDREISKTLIEFINKNKYQISTGTGEWQWLENNKDQTIWNV